MSCPHCGGSLHDEPIEETPIAEAIVEGAELEAEASIERTEIAAETETETVEVREDGMTERAQIDADAQVAIAEAQAEAAVEIAEAEAGADVAIAEAQADALAELLDDDGAEIPPDAEGGEVSELPAAEAIEDAAPGEPVAVQVPPQLTEDEDAPRQRRTEVSAFRGRRMGR